MLDKEIVKQIIKEMINDGEIYIDTNVYVTKEDYDCFGNSVGAISEVEVEIEIVVREDEK